MKTRRLIIIIPIAVLCALILSPLTLAYQKEDHKLVQFQMAILKKGPKWATATEAERNQILHQHLRNVVSLLQTGKRSSPAHLETILIAPAFLFSGPHRLKKQRLGSTQIQR